MSGKNSATPDSALRVLYDGGPLVFDPGGPAALHLLEILEALPESVEPWLALPRATDTPSFNNRLKVIVEPAQNRLRWEQATLTSLIHRTGAGLLHTTTLHAPLFNPAPCVISPAEALETSAKTGLLPRLSESLGRGGLSRASVMLWPRDLPPPQLKNAGIRIPVEPLSPRVHNAFSHPQPLPAKQKLPDAFVFCPGPLLDAELSILANAWRWAGTGPGADYTLLIEGLSSTQQEQIERYFRLCGVQSLVSPVVLPDPVERAAIFQRAELVLCCGTVVPWGDSLLQALASERPVAAVETPASDARLGPAGYLAPPGDARTLGAAIVTLLVEEPLREQITAAAQQRAAGWKSDQFSSELENAYWRIYRRVNAT